MMAQIAALRTHETVKSEDTGSFRSLLQNNFVSDGKAEFARVIICHHQSFAAEDFHGNNTAFRQNEVIHDLS